MDNLTEGKAQYVPSNGIILATSSVQYYDGETVFEVLKRACNAAGIQLEYSWTPMYDSYYIEGINHLYEFDCGSESGWMYKVNGWFPNYGCSAYTLEGRRRDRLVLHLQRVGCRRGRFGLLSYYFSFIRTMFDNI